MNKLYLKYVPVLLSLLLSSCTKDAAHVPGPDDGTMITFSIKVPGDIAPSSRALTTPDESAVATMDILLFDVAANGGGFLYHTTADNVTIDANREGTFSVQLPIGTFDMVLIANARAEVAREVAAFTPASTKTDLQNAHIADQSGKWPAASPNHDPIPMWAEHNGAVIALGTTISGVNLMRAVAKINVEVTAPNFKLTEVHLYHPLPHGFIIPDPNNISAQKAHSPTLDPAWVRSSGSFGYTTSANEVTATACKNEIYTFEAPAGDGTATNGSNMTNGNTFLVIGGEYDGDGYTTYYRVDIAAEQPDGTMKYLPLLRNHRYEVMIDGVAWRGATTASAAVAQGPANIKAEVVVRNEADMHYYVFDDQYFLGADDRDFRVGSKAGSYSFNVRTDYPTGWTARASDSPTDPNAGVTGNWLNIVPPASGAMGTGTLAFSHTDNPDTENDRIAYIHIMAGGRLDAVVKITQAFKFDFGSITNTHQILHGYVGAFWRKDQTGERLIRMRVGVGTWSASVVVGDDWIVLDTEETKDGNIYTENAADMRRNDASYQVNSKLTTVSGNVVVVDEYINFRIGLRSTYSPPADGSAPARYGVILLKYRDEAYRHIIFVRQGEDPDYLMRPNDSNGDGTVTTEWGGTAAEPRPYARKWSPYNLTAEQFNNGVSDNAIQLPKRSTLVAGGGGTGGGVFTDYPSMAGAFFKWAGESGAERYAYHPSVRNTDINSSYTSGFWSALAADHETCPPGYRRPTDGSTTAYNLTGDIAGSEQRQSLYLDPKDGYGIYTSSHNGISGFYADGYFDRQALMEPHGFPIFGNVAVNSSTSRVGYTGMIYYNPETYASLFMPACGSRFEHNLQYNGAIGCYSSSSISYSSSVQVGQYFHVPYTYLGQAANREVSCASTIRCVLEE